MNKVVLTVTIGRACEYLAEVTHPTIAAYAEKIGADFRVITERTGDWHPSWERFALYDLLGTEYDRALYIDTDCLVRSDTPDLFSLVPETYFGGFNEGRFFLDRENAFREGCRQYGCPELEWTGRYFNAGVMVLSRRHRHLFWHPKDHLNNFIEQTYINLGLVKYRMDTWDIRHEFNFMPSFLSLTGEPMESAYIPHFAGMESAVARKFAEGVLEGWKRAAPEYDFRRRIWLDVGGGLGDVIDAEPVVRQAVEKVFAGHEIRVTSRWPRPLDGRTHAPVVFGEDNPYGNAAVLKLMTKPEPGTGIWQTLTQVQSNATDFASIAALKRQLPIADRQIELSIFDDDRREVDGLAGDFPLERAVLVHAGRSWPSRTFPVSWWQEIVDQLVDRVPVVLVGRSCDANGVLPVEADAGVLDLRERTSLGALFELVRRCPVLVSNDSGPVHAAGAFDNWIVLIPSARHPDLVLPWRQGSPYYKARALYKRLTIDDVVMNPSVAYPSPANELPDGPWTDYLPEAELVASAVFEILDSSVAVERLLPQETNA